MRRAEELAQLAPENPEFMPAIGKQEYKKSNTFVEATAGVDPAFRAQVAADCIEPCRKDKLVAAAQPGLDRAKIQTEVTELQAQLSGMAGAATLQGQNWLSVDSSAAGYNATKSIVSSISRAGGSISVQTISVNTASMVLFDTNAAANGILDSTRNATTGVVDPAGTFTIARRTMALCDVTAGGVIIVAIRMATKARKARADRRRGRRMRELYDRRANRGQTVVRTEVNQ